MWINMRKSHRYVEKQLMKDRDGRKRKQTVKISMIYGKIGSRKIEKTEMESKPEDNMQEICG